MTIVKKEKVANKTQAIQETKDQGTTHRRGKERAVEAEDDENANEVPVQHIDEDEGSERDAEGEAEDDHDLDGDDSEHAAKRQRVNGEGRSRLSNSQEQEAPRARQKTLPRDTDGYIPGSIFRCGPYLNMILGPNGTGKSSIACAIALGLNFSPNILGRASELNSFVKLGTDSGYIEIELKGPKGKGNYVIRRNLTSKSRSSTFNLNGETVTAREITARVQELNVQVANLCSFLPQDKVSEFAAMTPQQLLRETQRAAGDERLTMWHDTLINSGRELRIVQELMREEQDQLSLLQERNAAIERDVQRFRERKRIEHEIDLLQVLIPVEEYRVLRKKYVESKALQRTWHNKVMRLKEKNAPVHELLQKLENQFKSHEKRRETMKTSAQAKFKKMTSEWQKAEKLDNEADEITQELSQLKQNEKERQRRIRSLENEIEQLTQELAKPVKLEKTDDLNDEQRKANQERANIGARKEMIESDLKRNVDASSRKRVEAELAQSELKKLDDLLVRKMQNMLKWDRDTHDVILWLRKNQHQFKMGVIEPPAIVLNVPDGRFVDNVEACFSSAQLRTFIAQCQEDLDLFNKLVNDSQGEEFGRKVRVTTWFRPYQEQSLVPPPMSKEELHALGFDGYALDYVDCPQGMHWFLKRELNLHRTAIALRPDIDVGKVMELVTRMGPNGAGSGANFFNGTTHNIVTRSRYGKRAVANMTKEIRQARTLRAVMIDADVKRNYEGTIKNAQQQISLFEEERKKLECDLKAVHEEDKIFQEKLGDIKKRKDAILAAETQRIKQKARLQQCERTRQQEINKPSAERQRVELKQKLWKISHKRAHVIKEYRNLVNAVVADQRECCKVGLEGLQISVNRTALKEECERKDEKYKTALIEFKNVDAAYQRVKQESKEMLEVTREVLVGISQELRGEYEAIENKRTEYDKALKAAQEEGGTLPSAEGVDTRSLDELKTELETQRANLELNLNTNPGIVEQYERRKREIEALEKSLEEKHKRVSKYERSIKTARDNWQPALEKLVASIGEKFSAAFDRIGCAGELRITPYEDYEKWAIDILVKFRDSEKLQLLTGQRQSGGERSLTTILYLMSLTEEARAPFSLVDEINQGMDQRAERIVHNSMVEVTCKPDAAQYFLITPKLLPDLEYHERMKILCVNNGEWLPEERNLGNMMDMIQRYVERNGPGQSSAAM
ncbi:hypothetical protein AX17_003102 [Amanita inopinata Kibby_2008]|nr:hypothetical protein AX17_003102 [Amanita inopinata Kibby_2008]